MDREGFYLLQSVIRHRYRQGWRFLTLWEGFGVEEATWESLSAFVFSEGRPNSVLVDYLLQNNLGELLRLAETLAPQKKPRDGTLPILAYVCVSVLMPSTHEQAAEMVSYLYPSLHSCLTRGMSYRCHGVRPGSLRP